LKDLIPFHWRKLSPHPVIGVDEAGRGCLAGPVYAGALILNEKASDPFLSDYKDSKQLSEDRREGLFENLRIYHRVGVGFATEEEIFEINILQASLLAMKRAVFQLGVSEGHVIVDGRERINLLSGFSQTTVIKGDQRALPIAAASIIAKVSRDRHLRKMAKTYPNYGFEKHKGYSTKEHQEKIKRFGPCSIHRRSFAGVREFWPEEGNP